MTDEQLFEQFKLAVALLNDAAKDAENYKDITIHLENAFTHPLYHEHRQAFATQLATPVFAGIYQALK
jgi:predicted acetyltransferase